MDRTIQQPSLMPLRFRLGGYGYLEQVDAAGVTSLVMLDPQSALEIADMLAEWAVKSGCVRKATP